MRRIAAVALQAVIGTLAFGAAPLAWADDGTDPEAGGAAGPAYPGFDTDVPVIGEAEAQPVPGPSAADRAAAGACAPDPCSPCPPCRVFYLPPPCAQPRDVCGWPLDWCGQPYGPWDVSLELMASLLNDLEGPFGLQTYGEGNQLTWDEVDYGIAPGLRLTADYRFSPFDRFEARLTYYGHWEGDSHQIGVFGAYPGDSGTGDTSRLTDAQLSAEATLWGGELNWWTELSCEDIYRFEAGAGVRVLSFTEDALALLSTSSSGPGGFPQNNSLVHSEVDNFFYGVQAIGALHVDLYDLLTFTGSARVMGGNLLRKVTVNDDSIFAGGTHLAKTDDEAIVFGFELGLGLEYRFANCWQVIGGYNFLLLDDVQRADDAQDFNRSNSGAVQARIQPDQIVVHSLVLGVTLNF